MGIYNRRKIVLGFMGVLVAALSIFSCTTKESAEDVLTDEPIPEPGNPIITEKYTADPAALVYQDTVFLYVGHDQAEPGHGFYDLREWLVYSSTDLVNWQEYEVPLRAKDFEWASGDAWAAEVIHHDGKFYWYTTVTHAENEAKAIGVAVSDSPTGPYKDARGSALVTNDMTTNVDITWDDIDPTVFVDDDGQAYMFWGNTQLYYSKLKENMIELEGEIKTIDLPHFTEAPWIHKKNGYYYLSYAYKFPERTAYAMSDDIEGPYYFKGILNEVAGNTNTNHQAIIDYKGQSYFFYHTGNIPTEGSSYRRSVSIDSLHYNEDGTLQRVQMTTEGVGAVE
ncbi:glycoside hydrolase family 43 protein [Fodinibius sp. Rm-B-1B1-1]|uniref:glycoside hydrolase family 43 protein n=1 Tax=Fodinibius alkaliphilus TaxID=3140241 RepID=UPI00315A035A